MKKLLKIKPKPEVFYGMGVRNTKVEEVLVFPLHKKVELKCCFQSCEGFKELEIIEANLKKHFGAYFEFNFNLNFSKKEISEEEIHIIIENSVKELKRESAVAKAYFGIFEHELHSDTVYFKLESKVGIDKLYENKLNEKLECIISGLLSRKMKIKLTNGDFSEFVKEVEAQSLAEQEAKLLEEVKLSQEKKSISKNEEKKEKDDRIIYGKLIKQEPISFTEFDELYAGDNVIIDGEVFKFETRDTSKGGQLISFNITNYKDSISVKVFLKPESKNSISMSNGIKVRIKGRKQPDKFNQGEDTIFASHIMKLSQATKKVREDNSDKKRVELHAHSKMSDMDSVAEVEELIERAASWGHKAIAITDHGVVHSFPFAYKAAKKYKDFKAILGCEGYLVDDEVQMVVAPKDIPIEEETYVVFDIETTGFDPYNDAITEIGAVKLKGNKIIDRFSSFVNPERPIPFKIIEITKITDAMVKDAPKIQEILPHFIEFVGDATVVAHNANFDVGFIKQKSKLINRTFENSVIDTLQWSKNILKDLKRHNLKALSKYFNVSLEGHHRAVNDAEATAEIFQKFIGMLLRQNIYKLTEVDDAFENNIKKAPTYHVIILVKNLKGLKNLYEIVSKAHIEHFYRSPRIPKSLLKEKREGLIIGSACESGELIQAYFKGKTKQELKKIAEFYDYLEIQPNSNNMFLLDKGIIKSSKDLDEMNSYIYSLGKDLSKPVVATGDVHYLDPKDHIYRSILMYGKGFKDFDRDSGLYMRTTEEMLDEFAYLGSQEAYEVVIENPNKIADMVEKIQPVPDGFYPPKIEGAEEQVREMTYKKAKSIYGEELPEIVERRIERELSAIIGNGFAVLYLISHKLVKKSLDDGYLVGSRGSVGSSLVAYMMDITEVNALYPHYICKCKYSEFMDFEGCGVDLPDKACPHCGEKLKKDGFSIPFEVFMGFNGDKVPDIDLNFSGEYQGKIHKYTEELFGKENVFRAGTISTLAEKNAYGYVKKYVEENEFSMRKAEMERLAKGCENVRKTTGQHPGGMIVVPYGRSIYEFTPVQRPANDMKSSSITTHFDYHVMDEQLVKLDILGHDDPTTIKLLQEYTGIDIHDVPLADSATLSIFNTTKALGVEEYEIGSPVGTYGVPEFGTQFVRQMLIDTRPTTFAELVRISGLSHGTDVWLNNAQNYIKNGIAQLSEVISVRDDIMNYLIDNGIEKGTAFTIMEFVRKGKPSKDPEKWKEYSELMKEKNVKDWYIESCQKIKYMFPKGHAVAYVMMAMRIAYFKVHHPLAFYAAFLSRKASDFNSETMLKGLETIRNKKIEYDGKMKLDVKEKSELTLLEILLEMHYRKIEMLGVDLYKSASKRFLIEDGKIRVPLIAVNGLGEAVVENIVSEREKAKFLSFEDLMRRTKASKTVVEKLKEYEAVTDLSDTTQRKLF